MDDVESRLTAWQRVRSAAERVPPIEVVLDVLSMLLVGCAGVRIESAVLRTARWVGVVNAFRQISFHDVDDEVIDGFTKKAGTTRCAPGPLSPSARQDSPSRAIPATSTSPSGHQATGSLSIRPQMPAQTRRSQRNRSPRRRQSRTQACPPQTPRQTRRSQRCQSPRRR